MCLLFFVMSDKKNPFQFRFLLPIHQKKIHLLTNIYIHIHFTQAVARLHTPPNLIVIYRRHRHPPKPLPIAAVFRQSFRRHFHFDLLPLHRFNYSFILIFTFLLSVSIHIYFADSVTIDMNNQ